MNENNSCKGCYEKRLSYKAMKLYKAFFQSNEYNWADSSPSFQLSLCKQILDEGN